MDRAFIHDPDWVMLGAPDPDGGVMLVASNVLSLAEVRAALNHQASGEFTPAYEVAATIDTYVLIHGDTYADALRRLFAQWTPDRPAAALVPPQRALEATHGHDRHR